MEAQEINKKTIDDYKSDYYYFTGKASDINRNLALGGIAIIWIFKTTALGEPTIPKELLFPLIALVISLALDLFQYIAGGIIWFIFYKYKEHQIKNNKIKADADIKAHYVLPSILHLIYWAKLTSNIVAYIFLFSFIYNLFLE